jgi:subtilisin family serine protease
MHVRSTVAALAAVVLVAGCRDDQSVVAPAPALATSAPAKSAAKRHLVVFKAEAAVPSNFESRVQALGGKVVMTRSTGIAVVSGLSDAAAATLRRQADVSDVEASLRVNLAPAARQSDVAPADISVFSPTEPNTAFRYAWQWNYRQVGMETVWASKNPNRLGKPTVTVAILDTGMDPNHADTFGRVDAALSKSFVVEDDALLAHHYPTAPKWTDLHGHGTHVGNTVSSNATRVAGMTSMTKLIAVKVLDVNGSGWDTDIFAGLAYAADLDVDVINMSLGSFFQKRIAVGYHRFLSRATKDAHQQGSLIVVSAGNSAINMDKDRDGFKAYCSAHNVVCVSATGPSTGNPNTAAGRETFPAGTNFDELAVYSNYGRHDIDVAAPGGNYNAETLDDNGNVTEGGFIWQACSQTILLPTREATEEKPLLPIDYVKFGCGPLNLLGFVGTSQASPHVSGLAAMLSAQMGNNNPTALRNRILETADDLGAPGRDAAYGHGRINAARALGIIN